MKQDAYIRGVPDVTKEDVADFFNCQPAYKRMGYVRKIRSEDLDQSNFQGSPPEEGQFAYFLNTGQLYFWAPDMDTINLRIEEWELSLHSVH